MAEPVLDQPRVMAGIGQGVAAGVAQHVGMDPERGNLSVWSRLLSTETVACDYCGSTPPTLPVSSCSSCSSFGPTSFRDGQPESDAPNHCCSSTNGRTRRGPVAVVAASGRQGAPH